jgi:hypothetical protein
MLVGGGFGRGGLLVVVVGGNGPGCTIDDEAVELGLGGGEDLQIRRGSLELLVGVGWFFFFVHVDVLALLVTSRARRGMAWQWYIAAYQVTVNVRVGLGGAGNVVVEDGRSCWEVMSDGL